MTTDAAVLARLAVGDEAPPRVFGPLSKDMFVRYAGASGDFNPMHYDDDLARSAGYPSAFGQGMLTAALLATFVTDWLGPWQLQRYGVRFRGQVWPGDTLICTGRVTAVDHDHDRVTVEMSVTRPDGAVAVTGFADYRLAS
ncbi:MaoC/PaaZ C-terminal domain-containing protein [Mycobacterium seoulense]|uniref:MaoC/PaaZ C-terminal domain-containing protein n=1 Tax=Mycobacterium seoulense TaxID=386911 RepID=UPI003CEC7D1E